MAISQKKLLDLEKTHTKKNRKKISYCAVVGGGGGIVPTTGLAIIGGTIGITVAAVGGSFSVKTSLVVDGGRLI